jgi:hypothetical protein
MTHSPPTEPTPPPTVPEPDLGPMEDGTDPDATSHAILFLLSDGHDVETIFEMHPELTWDDIARAASEALSILEQLPPSRVFSPILPLDVDRAVQLARLRERAPTSAACATALATIDRILQRAEAPGGCSA